MKPRIGDRFKHINVWEITGDCDEINHYPAVLVVDNENKNTNNLGDIGWFDFSDKYIRWQYLGNFNKSNNFSNLYELLSSE